MKRYPMIGYGLPSSVVQAVVPEWWAMETLEQMDKKKVLLGLVNRDYDKQFARFGDTVNVHSVGAITAHRKHRDQSVVKQRPALVGKSVVLNQHIHVSVEIDDVDFNLAQPDLIAKYSPKAATALIDGLETVVTGEVYNFLAYAAGGVGLTAGDNTDTALLQLREYFQRNNVNQEARALSVGPSTDRLLLGTSRYVSAGEIIDPTAVGAIRNGFMGRARGFNIYESSFAPEIAPGQTTIAGAINHAGGYLAGTTTLTVDTFSGALTNGSWCLIAGENLPHRITAATGTPCTSITISPALRSAVAHDAVITVMQAGVVDNPDSEPYPYLWAEEIAIDSLSETPRVGQGLTFGNSSVAYMITAVDSVAGTVLLNRPLDEVVSHGATAALIPYGNYNLALNPAAVTFVNRPLAPNPVAARSGYAVSDNLALRVTLSYDSDMMITLLTFDTLCTVQTLNSAAGGVLVS